jgi:hypothetical protein
MAFGAPHAYLVAARRVVVVLLLETVLLLVKTAIRIKS